MLFAEAALQAACPSGIDVYFENVGGAVQAAKLARLRRLLVGESYDLLVLTGDPAERPALDEPLLATTRVCDSFLALASVWAKGELEPAVVERVDLRIEDARIVARGPDLQPQPNDEVVALSGKLVFPGFIDPPVHIYLPCLGTQAEDTH